MGFLSKLVKKPFKDVKKVAKVVRKVDPIARTGMKLDPIARKITGGGGKKTASISAANAPNGARSRPGAYTTGQGNAPAPRKAVMPKSAKVPPVRAAGASAADVPQTLRKSAARRSLSTLGTGKYRIK